MNKAQKQAANESLRNEATVLRQTREAYKEARANLEQKIKVLSERDQTQSVIWQRQYQEALKQQLDTAIDALSKNNYSNIRQYLEGEYENGFLGTMYSLQKQGIPLVMPINQKRVAKMVETTGDSIKLSKKLWGNSTKLKNPIRREVSIGFASGESYQQVAARLSRTMGIDYNKSVRIARTEGGRVNNGSRFDAMRDAKKSSADIVKQWDSTLDGRTRPEHRELDGQIAELDDPFKIGNAEAQYPHDFGVARLDVNCRCVVVERARWAVDGSNPEFEDYTKYSRYDQEDFDYEAWKNGTLPAQAKKHGGGVVDLSDAKNFNQFKERYKDAAKVIATQQAAEAVGIEVMGAVPEIAEVPKTLGNYDQNVQWAKESMEQYFEEYRGLPSEYWEPFDTYLANVPKYEKQLENAFKKFEFASNTDSKAVEKVLRDGEYKSYAQTGKTNGDASDYFRKSATEDLFGLYDGVDDFDPSDFEKYGYLGKAKRAENLYGNNRIVYKKDNLWNRTTFTVGDSANALHVGTPVTPTKVSKPSVVSYTKDPFKADSPHDNEVIAKAIEKTFKSIEENGYFRGVTSSQDYVELQFHGKITTNDIEYIEVPEDVENLDEILKLAKKRGVKIKIKKKRGKK